MRFLTNEVYIELNTIPLTLARRSALMILSPTARTEPSLIPPFLGDELIQRLLRRRVAHHPAPLTPRAFAGLGRVGGAPSGLGAFPGVANPLQVLV